MAATRVNSARISHLSALAFHGLTTQNPREVWVTIPRTVRKPETDALPLRVVRCQTDMLDEGLEWHEIEAAKVPVYSVARTLVDRFRQRNKLGIDVAIEALREAWRGKRFQLKELNRLATRFRMARVTKPYLESLLALTRSIPWFARAAGRTGSFILHGRGLDPTISARVVIQRASIVVAAVDPDLPAVLQKDGV